MYSLYLSIYLLYYNKHTNNSFDLGFLYLFASLPSKHINFFLHLYLWLSGACLLPCSDCGLSLSCVTISVSVDVSLPPSLPHSVSTPLSIVASLFRSVCLCPCLCVSLSLTPFLLYFFSLFFSSSLRRTLPQSSSSPHLLPLSGINPTPKTVFIN